MKKIHTGDAFIVKSNDKTALIQYIGNDNEFGHLVRALQMPDDCADGALTETIAKPEMFLTFFPLTAAIRRGICDYIGHYDVPAGASQTPAMKRPGARAPDGRILTWLIIRDGKEYLVSSLSEDEKDLSIAAICNDTKLVERVNSGWQPRDYR